MQTKNRFNLAQDCFFNRRCPDSIPAGSAGSAGSSVVLQLARVVMVELPFILVVV